MNFIGVIACLGLLCGTLFESGAVPVDASTNHESVDGSLSESCDNCAERIPKGVSSGIEQPQTIANSAIPSKLTENSLTSDTSTSEKVAPKALNKDDTSEIPSQSTVTDPIVNNGPDVSTTLKPTDVTSTTLAPNTEKSSVEPEPTVKPTENPITTVKPTEKPDTTEKPSTTSASPPVTTVISTVPPTAASTKAAPTTQIPTEKPAEERRFDGPSFIGGIVFALGITAIGFVAWKFFKARTERNYHTL